MINQKTYKEISPDINKMITKTDDGLRVKKKRTNLVVSHDGKNLMFLHPPYGPNTYVNVGLEIENDGLAKPTMAETASLVHRAFISDYGLKGIMEDGWLWAFTGTLYVPGKGVYIQDDPDIRDGKPFMEESELVKELKADGARFVPFGFKIGSQSAFELAKNPYILGLAGEEGAEKLAGVADKNGLKSYVLGFESVNASIIRILALSSSLGTLGICIFDYSVVNNGYAFGRQKG